MYVYNAAPPVRTHGDYRYWSGVVPGDRSDLISTDKILPFDQLPQVIDPPSGWVQNCNDSPWTSTYPMVLDPAKFAPYIAPPPSLGARAQRSIRLLTQPQKFTLADLKALKRGVVRIAAPQLMSCTVLPQVIAGFKRACPEVQVRLFDCLVESVLGKVHSGEVDFGIGPEREPSADIEAQTLFELPFVVVFPPGHALEKKKRVRWDDALRFPLIALQGEYTQRLRVDLHESLRDQALQPVHEVSFMTTALAMVSAGLGVTTCLPYADLLIRLHQLQSRPLIEPVASRKFFVFTRRDRPFSPAAQRFVDYLFDHVARHHGAL